MSRSATARMPKCVVFDLDYTSWPLYVDTHVSPPIKRKSANHVNLVHDRYGSSMSFFPDIPSIFHEIHKQKTYLAIASRTDAVKAAKQALTELHIEGSHNDDVEDKLNAIGPPTSTVSAIKLFDQMEIYPGSKLTHLKAIHKKSGIPYEEMVFFDDEYRNVEVEKLGVTFILVDDGGVTRKLYEEGLATWRKKQGV